MNARLKISRMKNSTIELQQRPVDLHQLVDLVYIMANMLLHGKRIKLLNEVPATGPTASENGTAPAAVLTGTGNPVPPAASPAEPVGSVAPAASSPTVKDNSKPSIATTAVLESHTSKIRGNDRG